MTRVLFSVAAFGAVVSAAPSRRGESFTVTQVANPSFQIFNPWTDLQRTAVKYGGTINANAAAAVGKGTVTNTPTGADLDYLCPVSIDGQTLMLDFDTGSSDLWVFSTEQPSTQTSGHTVFNPATAKDYKPLAGYSWSILYGDGSTSNGDVGTAPVTVGGLTVASQAVEVAKNVSSSFVSNTALDGLLGLSFSSLNTVRPVSQKTYYDNVTPQLAAPVLGVDLKHLKPGTYDFGFIDSSKYKGSLVYTPVQLSYRHSTNGAGFYGYWNFSSTGYKVGTGSTVQQTSFGIADTGTTLLYLDEATVAAYYSKVVGAVNSPELGLYIFPCATTLPDFTIYPAGTSSPVVVKGQYIKYTSLLNLITITSSLEPILDGLGLGAICVGGMQTVPAGLPNIYGDIFLKSVFTVFENSASPRLGFAQKAVDTGNSGFGI